MIDRILTRLTNKKDGRNTSEIVVRLPILASNIDEYIELQTNSSPKRSATRKLETIWTQLSSNSSCKSFSFCSNHRGGVLLLSQRTTSKNYFIVRRLATIQNRKGFGDSHLLPSSNGDDIVVLATSLFNFILIFLLLL